MKQLNHLIQSVVRTHAGGAFLACLAVLAVIALTSSALVSRVQASPGRELEGQHGQPLAQEAELLELLADFHGALGYGGDITAMMNLWAEDSSITLNGTSHFGKDAVRAFFLSAGYFNNNWVSLAPEWKTTVTVHGRTAETSTQCVAIDLNASPMVVKSVIQVNATAERIQGRWLFTSMNNTTPAPL